MNAFRKVRGMSSRATKDSKSWETDQNSTVSDDISQDRSNVPLEERRQFTAAESGWPRPRSTKDGSRLREKQSR